MSISHTLTSVQYGTTMNSDKKTENGLTRSHFARLHDKIHNKYIEMQKKLHKQNLNGTEEEPLSKSTDDLLNEKCQMILEEVQETKPEVILLQKSESMLTLDTDGDVQDVFSENQFYSDDLQSFESFNIEELQELQELDSKYEDYPSSPPPTPSAKISIRHRIGSHIANVKEKRRSETSAKITKEKKKRGTEKFEKCILSNSPKDLPKTLTNHKVAKVGTVTVALIEARGWENDEDEKPRVLFCRLRLGSEKVKSKSVKTLKTTVKWQELYNFNLYQENFLEIFLWDKDFLLGRTSINLLELEKEKTHQMRISLEGEVANVQIFILLTISASVNNFDSDERLEPKEQLGVFRQNAIRLKKWNNFSELGWLFVAVHGAKGLCHQDCYCVVELGNERRMTPTEPKTCDPNWMKAFTFYVSDISEIIHFTIYDEKKSEEVGRISIPLLNIKNGERVYYTLKDYTQRERAKGNNARILLDMSITWNLTKAVLRVIKPKEEKYLEIENKLDRHLFAKNLSRIKSVYAALERILIFWKSSFEWESKKHNFIGIIIWLPFCYFFKTWMWPLLLLIPFVWCRPEKYRIVKYKVIKTQEPSITSEVEKDDKISLRQKIVNISDMIHNVQNTIGNLASFGERVKNLFNFTVPFLSWITIISIMVVAVILYFLPANYLLMVWGIHRYLRRKIRPNLVPNNEFLDLLSRVPDDETLLDCQEIPVSDIEEDKKQ